MSELTKAPCIFCGYNGTGYWQAGTHTKECPWHNVGGADAREVLPAIKALITERDEARSELDKAREALTEIANGHHGGETAAVMLQDIARAAITQREGGGA